MTLHDEATSLLGLGGNKGLGSGRNPEGEVPLHASSSTKARESLFMLLYLVSKDARTSIGVASLTWTINMLQLLAFVFDGKHFRWHRAADEWLAPKLAWINFAALKNSPDVLLPAFLVSLGLVALTAIMCLYIGWQFWSSGTVTNVGMLPLLQTMVRLLTSVLYVPVISILTAAFLCDNAIDTLVPCAEPGRLALIIGTAVTLLVFIVFNVIAVLVFVDDNPESLHAGAQVHGRVACAYLVVRAALSLLFVLFDDAPPVLAAAVLCAGVLTTGMYLLYLPFHRKFMNQMVVGTNAVFLWAGLCLVLAEYIGDKDDLGAFVGFLTGAGPAAYSAAMMVRQREDHLAAQTVHKHLSPYLAELICRFRLRPRKGNWREVGHEYRELLEIFPLDPFLTLHVASLYQFCGKNYVLAGQYIRRAQLLAGLRLDHRFVLFQYAKRQQEKANGTEGALSFVAFTHHRKNAERTLIDVLRQVHRLWSLVARGSEAEELFFAANEIHNLSKTAKTHLDKLVSISQSSRRSLLLYALYAEEVTQDSRLARRLRSMAQKASRLGEGNSDEDAALITINGEIGPDLGAVLEVSDSAERLLGCSRETLIGHNISALAPEPIRSAHDGILRQYVEDNTEFSADLRRKVWMLHAHGYVIPVELRITSQQDVAGMLRHTAIFQELRSDKEFAAVRGADWQLLFFSKGLMRDFGLAQVEGGAPLTSFIPQLANILSPAEATSAPVSATLEQGELSYGITMLRPPFKSSTMQDADIVMLRFAPPTRKASLDGPGSPGSLGSPASGSGFFLGMQGPSETNLVVNGRDERPSSISISAEAQRAYPPGAVAVPTAQAGAYAAPGRYVDNDGASSVGSSSTVNQSASLRRVVKQRIEQETARQERFRRLLKILGVLFGGLAVMSMVVQFVLDNRISVLLEQGILAAERASVLCALGSVMLSHVMGVLGFMDLQQDGLHARIFELAERLREVHGLTTESEARSLDEQARLLDDGSAVHFYDGDGASWRGRSLDTAVASMIAAAESFSEETDLPDGPACSNACRIVLNNGAYETLDAALESSRIFFDATLDVLASLDLINVVFLVGSICVLFAVLGMRMLPVLLEIRRTRDALSHALASVPTAMIKQLREQSAQRVETVKLIIDEINGITPPDQELGYDPSNPQPQYQSMQPQVLSMNPVASQRVGSCSGPGLLTFGSRTAGTKVAPLPLAPEDEQKQHQEEAIMAAVQRHGSVDASSTNSNGLVLAQEKQDEAQPAAQAERPAPPSDAALDVVSSMREGRSALGSFKPNAARDKRVSVRVSTDARTDFADSRGPGAAAAAQSRMLKKRVENRLNKKPDRGSLLRRVRAQTNFILDFVRLCMPMFVVVIYFGAIVGFGQEKNARLGPYSQTMLYVGKRWVLTTRLIFQADLTNVDYEPEWARWRPALSITPPAERTRHLLYELLNTSDVILYPNEEVGTLPMVSHEEWPDSYHIEFKDACQSDACRNAVEDLNRLKLKRGLNAALDRLVKIVEGILEGNHSRDSVIRFQEDVWLREASAEYMRVYSRNVLEMASAERRKGVLLCVAFLATLVLVLSVVARTFRQVNNELKNSQYVLLMLPAEVLTSAAGLQKLLRI